MPTIIPADHHIMSMTFNVSGSTHNVTITHAATNGGLVLPANMLAQWIDNLCTVAGRPYTAANMPTAYQRVLVKVIANAEGELRTAESTVALAGSNGLAPPPMNTAVLINKVTGIAGRKYRGRMFSPPFVAEASVSEAGQLTGGIVTLQAQWDAAYTGLTTNANPLLELQPVLLHGDGSPPTPVTSWKVSPRIGTIGRRMRR